MRVPGTSLIAAMVVFAGLLGVTGAKLHSRYKQNCDGIPCIHLSLRAMAVESVIAQRKGAPSYLVIGDSITEFADLPEICGRKPINAGLSGARTETFRTSAKRFAELSNPDFIVIALGTNDAMYKLGEGFRTRFGELLSQLKKWKVIAVPVPPSPTVPDVGLFNQDIASFPVQMAAKLQKVETTDGIHLSASSYETWKKNIVDAAQAFVCR